MMMEACTFTGDRSQISSASARRGGIRESLSTTMELSPNVPESVSIFPTRRKQRIKRIVWKANESKSNSKNGTVKNKFVNNINDWTEGHSFTSGISPKIITLLGKQIIARQLIEL